MALIRLYDEWPLLICGPILRRVEPDQVAVFVATKQACSVQLVVTTADGSKTWESEPIQTRRLGLMLHVTVSHLTIRGTDVLTHGVLYNYDLRLTPNDSGATETLADQKGLLTGREPLGYSEHALPSFALPPELGDLNIVHASCRKPHGGGPDGLAMVDQLIKRSREGFGSNQALSRPHMLLLTGDQIYADDVALSVLAHLIEAGGLLCGQSPEETFPGGLTMTAPQVQPGLAREGFLKQTAKPELSSDAAMNHLMFFAEFCAMYLMVWSDELWSRRDGRLVAESGLVEEKLRSSDAKERLELAKFLQTLRRSRRALANVPTLMMFDDHEVSDDWNIDGAWQNGARTNQSLHRIVRNGLLAFAVFQAWGNEPARFRDGPGRDLLDLVTVPPGGTASPIVLDPSAADVQLDLTTSAGTRMAWDWTIDGPAHRVIALDTRTRRYYPSPKAGAGLLSVEELHRQLTTRRPRPPELPLQCIVIAPAPVVGHPLVEGVLQPAQAGIEGMRAADHEAWSVNQPLFKAILRQLAEFGSVIVLSGDVHYAFSNHTAYFGALGLPPARIVQLCSSATKNADRYTKAIQFAGYLGSGEAWLGFSEVWSAIVADSLSRELDKTVPRERSHARRIRAFELFASPASVPAKFRSDTAMAVLRRLVAGNPNDWRYVVTFMLDERHDAERVEAALEINDKRPANQYLDIIRHAHKAVVGVPNIGQVRFRSDNQGNRFVQHRLHWMTPGGEGSAIQTCTEHNIPLDPPTEAERPRVEP